MYNGVLAGASPASHATARLILILASTNYPGILYFKRVPERITCIMPIPTASRGMQVFPGSECCKVSSRLTRSILLSTVCFGVLGRHIPYKPPPFVSVHACSSSVEAWYPWFDGPSLDCEIVSLSLIPEMLKTNDVVMPTGKPTR